jgi:hypothetical protein
MAEESPHHTMLTDLVRFWPMFALVGGQALAALIWSIGVDSQVKLNTARDKEQDIIIARLDNEGSRRMKEVEEKFEARIAKLDTEGTRRMQITEDRQMALIRRIDDLIVRVDRVVENFLIHMREHPPGPTPPT